MIFMAPVAQLNAVEDAGPGTPFNSTYVKTAGLGWTNAFVNVTTTLGGSGTVTMIANVSNQYRKFCLSETSRPSRNSSFSSNSDWYIYLLNSAQMRLYEGATIKGTVAFVAGDRIGFERDGVNMYAIKNGTRVINASAASSSSVTLLAAMQCYGTNGDLTEAMVNGVYVPLDTATGGTIS
jgi:hypothetical protein